MKLLQAVSFLTLSLSLSTSVGAGLVNGDHHNLVARHSRMAKKSHLEVESRSLQRRCKPRRKAVESAGKVNVNSIDNSSGSGKSKNNDGGDSAKTSSNKVTINSVSSDCGAADPSAKVTSTNGPNGRLGYLNCGVESGGWNPPFLKASDIVSVPLADALKDPNSPYHACKRFLGLFEKYAAKHGFSATILAAFAMQESSCDPETVGGGGEQGLMQITKEKCGGAPGGNCRDPDFNIRTGAQFFADTLDNNGGNFLLSVGMYNGWSKGLTVGKATAAKNSACCKCQNNLDYIFQFVNGWLQNINAYDNNNRLGKYFNLDVC